MRLISLMAAAAMAACGSLPEPSAPPPPAPDPSAVSSGTALERFFPLVDGHIYQYAVERSNGEEPMVVRAGRSSARGGTLQLPGGEKRFEYTAEGIHLVAGGAPVFVLKEPLTVGNSWRGEHGGTVEIVEVDATAEVPAGSYTGCVKTLERRGGDRPMQVATTFCPEVGIVVLEAASGGEMERAALTSYGPPLDLGPDGVRRIP